MNYRNSPTLFNREILKGKEFWRRQVEISKAFVDPSVRVILCPAGNGVGKSWLLARLALCAFKTQPDSKVITTGPTFGQLKAVLWGNILNAYRGSELNGQDAVRASDLSISTNPEHFLIGINPDNIEGASGYHGNVIAISDESSALTAAKDEAIASWNCRKRVYIGNPNWPIGPFYEKCTRQRLDPDPSVRLIKIPALESPAIQAGIRHSPDGLADLAWLDDMRREYGEDSNRWKVSVLAEFPDSSDDQLIDRGWLDLAFYAEPHAEDRTAPCMAIDLAAGQGGDRAVLLVRTAHRVLRIEASNRWDMEHTAKRAGEVLREFGIRPERVVYDMVGLGEGFGYHLKANGIPTAKGFKGGMNAKGYEKHFKNLKTAAAWNMRHRFDPKRNTIQFSIPREYEKELRPELQAWTFGSTATGQNVLVEKDVVKTRIGRSPDLSDTLIMSFVALDKVV